MKLWPDDVARQQSNLIEKGKRCTLGNFSVKSTATCDKWKAPNAAQP